MKIHINEFMGMAPRYGARKLPPGFSQNARNIDLLSKEIRPIQSALDIDTPTKAGTHQTIYPLNGNWLHWTTDVDVVPAPLQTQQSGRIYYTGDYNPKATDNDLSDDGVSTDYPTDFWRLGLPSPEDAPGVGVTGGSGSTEARSYVYTFVTAWGEEGPPSSPGTYTGYINGTWNLTGMNTAPLNTGNINAASHSSGVVTVTTTADHFLETGDYIDIASVTGMTDLNDRFQVTRISSTQFSVVLSTAQSYTSGGTWTREAPINTSGMTLNIYRTVSGVYKLVASGQTSSSYNDTTADADLGEEIPSTYWTSPSGDLKGLVKMPNGSLAGFYDNVLAFTPPYFPHAWPSSYEITFAYSIVAIATIGSSIVVATTGKPYLVTGIHPESMSVVELDVDQACVSKRSMISVGGAVIYASSDGLVVIPSSGSASVMTRGWLRKDDWDLYNPSSIFAAKHDDKYYGFYSGGGANGDEHSCFVFDPNERDSTLTVYDVQADAAFNDPEDDILYFKEDTAIKQYGVGGSIETYAWKSKIYTTERPVAFKCAKVKLTFGEGVAAAEQASAISAAVTGVDADIASGMITSTGAFGGYSPSVYTVAGGPYVAAVSGILSNTISATLRVYGNGVLYAEKQLSDSRPFRLPVEENVMCDNWEIELSGTDAQIHEITLAETMSELRQV